MTDENRLLKRLPRSQVRVVKDATGKTAAIESMDGALRLSAGGQVMNPGPKGETGADGHDGVDGSPGADGQEGVRGSPGAKGEPGQDGVDGLPGAAGAAGRDGEAGLRGAAGAAGQKGADGLPGAPGPQGLPGANGVPGKDGAPGAQGVPGAQGIPGVQGLPGLKGDPGTAANRVLTLRAQTDTSGRLTWAFPTAFAAGVLPLIGVAVQDTSAASFNHKVVALTNASVTIQLTKTNVVTLLGISVLGIDSNPQAFVHLTATAPA